MTYEEMKALQEKLAEKIGGDAIPFEPGEDPAIGLDDFEGHMVILVVSLA